MFDAGRNRVTFFSAGGDLREHRDLPSAVGFDQVVLCNSSRALFILLRRPTTPLVKGEVFQVPTALVRLRETTLDTIAAVGIQEYYVAKGVNAFFELLLGQSSLAAAADGILYLCQARAGVVTVFDSSGVRVREFSLALERHRVSAADWSLALRRSLSALPLARTRLRVEPLLRELSPPRDFPLVEAIRADVAGNLWVRTYDHFASAVATWVVLTRTGHPLGVATTPRRLDIHEIGNDYILGVSRDDDDVERVVVYGLRRP